VKKKSKKKVPKVRVRKRQFFQIMYQLRPALERKMVHSGLEWADAEDVFQRAVEKLLRAKLWLKTTPTRMLPSIRLAVKWERNDFLRGQKYKVREAESLEHFLKHHALTMQHYENGEQKKPRPLPASLVV